MVYTVYVQAGTLICLHTSLPESMNRGVFNAKVGYKGMSESTERELLILRNKLRKLDTTEIAYSAEVKVGVCCGYLDRFASL